MRRAPNYHSNKVLNEVSSRINKCIYMYVRMRQHKRKKTILSQDEIWSLSAGTWTSSPLWGPLLPVVSVPTAWTSLQGQDSGKCHAFVFRATERVQGKIMHEANSRAMMEGKCSLNCSSYLKQSIHSKIIERFPGKGNRWWIWYLWQQAPARHQTG